MAGYALRLTRDDLPAGATPRTLPALNRVLYVLAGDLTVAAGGKETRLAEHSAAFAGGATTPAVGPRGATVLRYELVREGAPPDAAGTLLLEHPIQLAAGAAVSDALRPRRLRPGRRGAAAPPQGRRHSLPDRGLDGAAHRGRIRTRTIEPGEAWFESGREPVYAAGVVRRADELHPRAPSCRARSAGRARSCTSIPRTPSAGARASTPCSWTSRSTWRRPAGAPLRGVCDRAVAGRRGGRKGRLTLGLPGPSLTVTQPAAQTRASRLPGRAAP